MKMHAVEAGALRACGGVGKPAMTSPISALVISTGGRAKMAFGTMEGASGTISGMSD